MAITAISDLAYGERSVAFTVFSPNPPPIYDTMNFSVIVDALTAAGVQTSAIKTFLSTSRSTGAVTAEAFAQNGMILSYVSGGPTSAYINGANTMAVGGGWTAIRLSLASTISA